ncbi:MULTISPECIES: phage head completion protein [Oceanobacillus]|uniref:phage head completion protein n=1 Tax=Oceanobacillus TaxID=182709 RepID=UPI0025A45471|nr:phage head-tail adapter protein [Oceanobacillus oncorhynchi]MDM8098663.1 phage head-tail adapter protein [Oceanobacillus oncorhynchi]
MRDFKYKPPRVHSGQLRTPITFYEYAPNDGPEPGESQKSVLYECMCKVDRVWLKDLELAKSNGTLSDITITIRDPQGDYRPNNTHYLEIDDVDYKDLPYNIVTAQPNLQDRRFIDIVAKVAKQ